MFLDFPVLEIGEGLNQGKICRERERDPLLLFFSLWPLFEVGKCSVVVGKATRWRMEIFGAAAEHRKGGNGGQMGERKRTNE